jgi:DNA-directed RNA polymerase specialized sigma24 family protein
MQKSVDEFQKEDIPFDERLFEDEGGIPDSSWINGETCSETFEMLTPLERRLLVKYYLEDYNDRQVAERFGMHINTVNQKRRFAAEEVANALGKSRLDIKRNRKSGKRPMMIVIK